mmetsp:Transcript_11975/g.11624  ORF Transcript_11975/g.11624 Transcript_11975/m.11624 type:complete len:394 (-) Transcript_11975:174-1355(-)
MIANESYDDKLFIQPQSDHLKCPICLIIMKDPVLCPTESCSFCRHCVSDHLDNDETCPNCRNPLTKQQLRPNRLICSLINDALVYCFSIEASEDSHIKSGKKTDRQVAELCDWSGKLHEAQGHYDQCLFARINCPHIGCNDVFFRKSLSEHEDNCLYRLESCKLCNQRKKFDLMEAHLLECPERPVLCPNGCLDKNGGIKTFSPRKMPRHRKVCAMEVIDCKFDLVGCEMKLPRKDILLHENDGNAHIGCLLTKINKLENYIETLSGDCESKYLGLKIPISDLVDVIESRTITVSGHSFHLQLYPNSNHVGWHSLYVHIEKDDDWVGHVDVEVNIELISYSDLHPTRKKSFKHIYQDNKNRGYEKFMETAVLGGVGYVKDEHITLKVKITINS